MARYALNLPVQLKKDAEACASQQGISLNQFVLWAVAEKVGDLRGGLDDPAFPHVTYRRGAAGHLTPVVRGTGVRVQTIVIATQHWGMTPEQFADDYGIDQAKVQDALAFYAAHRDEIDDDIRAEELFEAPHA